MTRRKAPKRNGRPPGSGAFQPTDEQRELVKMAATCGIPERRICHAIVNPKTDKEITPVTLRKHFRNELDRGLVLADIEAAGNLFKLTKTNASAAIFWAKVRLGWREVTEIDVPAAPGADGGAPENPLDIARRIAFTLALGARANAAAG